MSIKINYINKPSNEIESNLVFFIDEKLNINNLKKLISTSEFTYISDLLKISDAKKTIFVFEINSKKKLF